MDTPLPALIDKLSSIKPHALPIRPDDEDWEAHSDYVKQVARACAEWVEDAVGVIDQHSSAAAIAARMARETVFEAMSDELVSACTDAAIECRETAHRSHPESVWNHRQTGVRAGYRGL